MQNFIEGKVAMDSCKRLLDNTPGFLTSFEYAISKQVLCFCVSPGGHIEGNRDEKAIRKGEIPLGQGGSQVNAFLIYPCV